jgi:hypothetical protein
MNAYIRRIFFTLINYLACVAYAAPQDNWYKSASWGGVSGAENMIVSDDGLIWIAGNDKIAVHEQNGTLVKEFTSGLTGCTDVALDSNGNLYAAANNKLLKMDANGTEIWSVSSPTPYIRSLDIYNDSAIYTVSTSGQGCVKIFNLDGNLTKTIDDNSIGQNIFQHNWNTTSIRCFPNGNFIAYSTGGILFDRNGTYIKRLTASKNKITINSQGLYLSKYLRDSHTNSTVTELTGIRSDQDKCYAFTPIGDLVIARGNDTIEIWTMTYRTHGTVIRNVPPQPRLSVTQRAGTNLVDMDVEILDPDDATAKFAILGAVDGDFSQTSKWFVPTLTEGTDSKIDALLPTNQVHRLTWNTRADWSEIDGTFQFQVLCRDARRAASAVDLHFMTLPTEDGNMTISRSPLEDSDFETHYKYEMAAGRVELDGDKNLVNQVAAIPSGAVRYVFTNCGATGRYGPTWADVNGSYQGTNLEGNVNMGVHQGIQLWDVPAAGKYMIEVAGAGGSLGGLGALVRGTFDFNGSETLKILIGQMGLQRGGSGGTFVTLLDNSPIVIAGGAGGDGANGRSQTSGGGNGGTNGNGGATNWENGAGGGLLTDGSGGSEKGLSFLNGAIGGVRNTNFDGGFGGGGASDYKGGRKGSGGGYSGGGDGSGGGSFNLDTQGLKFGGTNVGHGKVIITKLPTGVTAGSGMQQVLFKSNRQVSDLGRYEMFNSLGYSEANATQLTLAREAGVSESTVKQWDPNSQVKPINLPGKVNAWGFDTEHTSGRYWWAVKN